MACIQCNFISKSLRKQTEIRVIIPTYELSFDGWQIIENNIKPSKKPLRTLYLYHGWSDDSSCWQRFTSIELYAQKHNIAVIMPDAEHSYYVDMAMGNRYGTYICEELVEFTRMLFPLSSKREDTFAAGLSMGGYGALYAALTYPDVFCATATLSGVTDIVEAVFHPEDNYSHFERVFGDLSKLQNSKYDLFYLLKNNKAEGKPLPDIFISCGDKEHALWESNKIFEKAANDLGYKSAFYVGHGAHEWPVWDDAIQKYLEWIDKK